MGPLCGIQGTPLFLSLELLNKVVSGVEKNHGECSNRPNSGSKFSPWVLSPVQATDFPGVGGEGRAGLKTSRRWGRRWACVHGQADGGAQRAQHCPGSLGPWVRAGAAQTEAPQPGAHHGEPALVSGSQGRTACGDEPGPPAEALAGCWREHDPGSRTVFPPQTKQPTLSPPCPCRRLPAGRRTWSAFRGSAVQPLRSLPGA